MERVNIHEARVNLSKLISKAANGESSIITRLGKPMAMVCPYVPETAPVKRVGFLKGKIRVPDDFDTMCGEEIRQLFEGAE